MFQNIYFENEIALLKKDSEIRRIKQILYFPEYGYCCTVDARLLYPKQSTSMHSDVAQLVVRRICRLIALVIRARLGKARHKWKFRGIAVHTRCFIPPIKFIDARNRTSMQY